MKTIPYLSHIFIYPIKSLAGIEVKQWEVAPAGFKYDRKWMLVDAQGNFLSQRNLPRMALIQTQIIDQQLVVSASGQEDLPINLQMPAGKTDHKVTIWNDVAFQLTILIGVTDLVWERAKFPFRSPFGQVNVVIICTCRLHQNAKIVDRNVMLHLEPAGNL